MKKMDGLEFTQEVREFKAAKELPIIGLSSENDAETSSLFLGAGANDYLVKPLTRDTLYEKIYENIH